jgi:hypothetical protein
MEHKYRILFAVAIAINGCLFSCTSKKDEQKEEHIRVSETESTNETDSLLHSIEGNASMNEISTKPNSVILTGLPDHRFITIYKSRGGNTNIRNSSKYNYEYDGNESEVEEHFMPGIDILYGYNLLNISHYDLKIGKTNLLFNHPALIKTFYYPSFLPDSINKVPVNRNFYLISVYDADTNKDTLINKKDLRRFYHFDSSCSIKTLLVPEDYSVIRSQYDSQNDVMYLFARHDENKNGNAEPKESIHIFWIDLKSPAKAKRMY